MNTSINPLFQSFAKFLAIALAYYLTGRLGLSVPFFGSHVTLFWLPSGIAVAAIIRYGWRSLSAVYLAAFLVNLNVGSSIPLALEIALGNTLAPAFTVWMLRRMNFHMTFDRQQDIPILCLSAALGMLISACNGVLMLWLAHVIPAQAISSALIPWWMGDFTGVLLATPLLLSMSRNTLNEFWLKRVEFVMWGGLAMTLAWLVFHTRMAGEHSLPLAFLPLPFAVWAALRFGITGAAVATLLLSFLAVLGTSLGGGPFQGVSQHIGLLMLWAFIVTLLLTNLMITALLAERKKFMEDLSHSEAQQNRLLNHLAEGVYEVDDAGNCTFVNQAFLTLLGFKDADEVLGKNVHELIHHSYPDGHAYPVEDCKIYLAYHSNAEITASDEVFWRRDGSPLPVEYWSVPIVQKGVLVGATVTFVDISARKQVEDALRENQARLLYMLETSPIAVRIAASSGRRVLFANERYAKLINSPRDQVAGRDPQQYYANPQDYEDILQQINHGIPVTDKLVELSIPGGGTTWAMASYRQIEYGNEPAVLGWFYDVTDLRETQEALQRSEQTAKHSLDELRHQKFTLDKHAIVAVTDVQGRITYANEKFSEISGYTQEELIGQDHAILNSGHHPKGFFKEMYRTIASGNVWHAEVCNRAKDGHLYWVDTTIAPFMGEDGKPQSYISIRTDITQRVVAEEKSNFLALYDQLTNLPNRRLLLDRLKLALASSSRSGKEGALLFIDLDDFKTLNDTLGHDIGDLLLQQVGVRLMTCVREGDTVSRLGGDEFVVMLEDLGEQDSVAAAQAELIGNKILAVLNQPYLLGMHTHSSTPSIGITLFNGHELEIDELLKQADIAMYQAKKSGRNAMCFFDPKVQETINTRAGMAGELRMALEHGQFLLHYQMQVNASGHPLGAEVLIRWRHPERGLVSPFDFIPLAEETGLIVPIGQWVLETTCAQLKAWQQNPLTRDLTLSVNVSAKQFRQVDFVDQVKTIVQRHGIHPNRLKLEPTESLLLENIESIIASMNTLKEIGIQFSLDDFGTGYSSLQYLKRLPLDQLKIDQSFVRDIVFDSNDKAIVTTIIAMAKSLGLDVIAEGVETEQQQLILAENGCMHYQGYLFSRPVPLDEFEALLNPA